MVLYASCEQNPAYLVIEMLVQPISCCRDHVPCIEHPKPWNSASCEALANKQR